MKISTKILISIIGLGFLYCIYKIITDQGGSSLGDVIDGLAYTSILLFFAALITIVFNFRHLEKHLDTFLFLLFGLPMTILVFRGIIENIHYNRTPDLTTKYPRPVSPKEFTMDSINIKLQIDSLIALKNRKYGGPNVVSAIIDTIIYSQSGKEIFVVYAMQYEPNNLGNDLDPDYLSADQKDSIYWHLREGPPRAPIFDGSYRNISDLKKAVRRYYFNQYSFVDRDSLKENYFWKR